MIALASIIIFFAANLLFVPSVRCDEVETTVATMDGLRKQLLTNYNIKVRPVLENHLTTVVSLTFEPVHILYMDEPRSTVYVEVLAMMSWEDQHLKWDPQQYGGIKKVHFQASEIWKPDVRILSGRSYTSLPWIAVTLSVYHTGQVKWHPMATLALICNGFNYNDYPNDVQTCPIEIGTWAETQQEVDFEVKDDTSFNFYRSASNIYWNILTFSGRKATYIDSENVSQVAVNYAMEIKRTNVPAGYLNSVPDMVARILVLCMFWMPDLNKKLGLGCVAIVLLTWGFMQINARLPSPAAAAGALREPTAALVLSTIALILEIVLSAITDLTVSAPVFVDTVAKLRVVQVLTSLGKQRAKLIIEDQEANSSGSTTDATKNRWELLAFLIEKIAFVVFAVLLLAI